MKFEFLKSELKAIEEERATTMLSEIGWSLTDEAFVALQRRAERLKEILPKMHFVWVDDLHPFQNLGERRALAALGISIDPVKTTDEALRLLDLARYEGVITDYSRPDDQGAARLLEGIKKKNLHRQTIFYAGHERPIPAGDLGYTVFPDELIHLVMDLAERGRSVGGSLTSPRN